MRAILMFDNCQGQSHKTVSRERRAEADSNRGPSAYQTSVARPNRLTWPSLPKVRQKRLSSPVGAKSIGRVAEADHTVLRLASQFVTSPGRWPVLKSSEEREMKEEAATDEDFTALCEHQGMLWDPSGPSSKKRAGGNGGGGGGGGGGVAGGGGGVDRKGRDVLLRQIAEDLGADSALF